MKLMILSDIHGNLSALQSVLDDSKQFSPDAMAILGDVIDYGTRSEETVQMIEKLEIPKLCYLWGNHEYAILKGDYSRFSSPRGAESAKYTASRLTEQTVEILGSKSSGGRAEFEWSGMRFLAVHGSVEDNLWGSISVKSSFDRYENYDYVLSGHNHRSHYFSIFFPNADSPKRGEKRTVFINPGSVGQPRNHDSRAQYAILDTEGGIALRCVEYDIAYEQSLYGDKPDKFYRDRLSLGI